MVPFLRKVYAGPIDTSELFMTALHPSAFQIIFEMCLDPMLMIEVCFVL